MSAGDVVLAGLAAVLVLVAAALAGVQSALIRATRFTVYEVARRRPRSGRALAGLVEAPTAPLTLVLLLRTGCELGATVSATLVVVHARGSGFAALAIAVAVMTLVNYLLVGVVGRTVGTAAATRVAGMAARPVSWVTTALGPLVRLLLLLTRALTPGGTAPHARFASEAELRDLVGEAEESGLVDRRERELINSVFDLGDTIVREVMVPRPDVVFIERFKTVKQALALALRSGFSRIPVVGDGEDDVVGIAYLKDLARRFVDGHGEESVTESMRPTSFAPDSKKADELLREMQARRIHLAIVVDEYGGTAGLVTIEDILEEIVGEIADEYDREGAPVERVAEGVMRVTARLPVEDLAELFGVRLEPAGVDTVGGLLATTLGRVPIPGARAQVAGLTLLAESAAGRRNRIGTVLVSRAGAGRAAPGGPAGAGEGEG
ncbi:MAG: hemolysin family protein [Mycobacteriales bacterium]